MADKTYNGWTNYATWRINLEIFDGIDPREMGWHKDTYDLLPILRNYVRDVLEMDAKQGLALDYALAFIEDVNWHEIANHMLEEYSTPFHVVGIDEDDGNATILEEFNNSAEAKEWLLRYASKEDAGGWKRLEVLDTREECAETVFSWNAEEIAA